jgi:hypothetical protein
VLVWCWESCIWGLELLVTRAAGLWWVWSWVVPRCRRRLTITRSWEKITWTVAVTPSQCSTLCVFSWVAGHVVTVGTLALGSRLVGLSCYLNVAAGSSAQVFVAAA